MNVLIDLWIGVADASFAPLYMRTPMNLKQLGQNIRDAYRPHMSQTELANMIGVTPKWLSAVVCGDREPSLDLLYKIADHCRTTLSELVRGTESSSPHLSEDNSHGRFQAT